MSAFEKTILSNICKMNPKKIEILSESFSIIPYVRILTPDKHDHPCYDIFKNDTLSRYVTVVLRRCILCGKRNLDSGMAAIRFFLITDTVSPNQEKVETLPGIICSNCVVLYELTTGLQDICDDDGNPVYALHPRNYSIALYPDELRTAVNDTLRHIDTQKKFTCSETIYDSVRNKVRQYTRETSRCCFYCSRNVDDVINEDVEASQSARLQSYFQNYKRCDILDEFLESEEFTTQLRHVVQFSNPSLCIYGVMEDNENRIYRLMENLSFQILLSNNEQFTILEKVYHNVFGGHVHSIKNTHGISPGNDQIRLVQICEMFCSEYCREKFDYARNLAEEQMYTLQPLDLHSTTYNLIGTCIVNDAEIFYHENMLYLKHRYLALVARELRIPQYARMLRDKIFHRTSKTTENVHQICKYGNILPGTLCRECNGKNCSNFYTNTIISSIQTSVGDFFCRDQCRFDYQKRQSLLEKDMCKMMETMNIYFVLYRENSFI